MNLKKLIALFLIPLMIFSAGGFSSASGLTAAEKEELYRGAVLELEAYLESGSGEVHRIAEVFRNLGGYAYSRMFRYYAALMDKASRDEYDYETDVMLSALEYSGDFQAFLEENRRNGNGSALAPVSELKEYILGKRAQKQGDTEEAIRHYQGCILFFDASERYMALSEEKAEETYQEAAEYMNRGDWAGAYMTYSRIRAYDDSEIRMNTIAEMLGYTPKDENDNPGDVTGLSVTASDTREVTLRWDEAIHATGYEVAFRESGTQAWTVFATVTGTTATVTGLKADTAYDLSVTAVAGRVPTRRAELSNHRTAAPTATPLALGQVTGLRVEHTGENEAALARNSVPYAEQYEAAYRESGGDRWTVFRRVSETAVTITGLKADTAYDFSVTAVAKAVRSQGAVLSGQRTSPAPKVSVKVDDIITFGHYPQNAAGNDSTAIEWIVLEVDEKNHKALVISRYGLDAKPYHTVRTDITWADCSLRSWLNGEFMNKAFTSAEQAAILLTDVDNSSSQGYSGWSTSGGENTQDRIFLLSYAEADRYFGVILTNKNNIASRAVPTAYAKAQGALMSRIYKTVGGEGAGEWWLRSSGTYRSYAALVSTDGSLYSNYVDYDNVCVRPACWINFESGIF